MTAHPNSTTVTRNERPRAIILLILVAILWSLGGLLIKSVHAHPLAIAGVRSGIAACLFILVLGKPKITGSAVQLSAAASYTGTVIFFVLANKTTTAANAIFLQYTAPIYVALLSSWLLKERTRLLDWVTVVIVFGGMGLFFLDNLSTSGLIGNIFAVLSGVFFALQTLFLRMQKDGSPWESIFLGNIFTAFIGIPFLFTSWPNTTSWLILLVLGVVQLGLPYILFSKAIKHTTALEAILIPVLEPILNPLWVVLFLGERPGTWSLVGGFIVLVAITARCVVSELQFSISQKEKISHT